MTASVSIIVTAVTVALWLIYWVDCYRRWADNRGFAVRLRTTVIVGVVAAVAMLEGIDGYLELTAVDPSAAKLVIHAMARTLLLTTGLWLVWDQRRHP